MFALKKEEIIKPKASRRKEIIPSKAEIKKRKTIEKIKSGVISSKKINKIDKYMTQLIKKAKNQK